MKSHFSVDEAAKSLKVSTSTIRRAIREGRLAVNRSPHGLTIHRDALRAYVAPRTVRRTDGLIGNASWTILNGDVRDALKLIAPNTVSCVITSPPYYWQRDYRVRGQLGHEQTIAEYVTNMTDVFRAVREVLKEDGTLFLNLGDTYYAAKGRPHGTDDKHRGRQMMRRRLRAVDGPGLGIPRKSLIGIPWRVALALQSDGWVLRSAVIWQRPGSIPEPSAHDRPWRTYENIFIFSKRPKYYFKRSALRKEEDIWRISARPEHPGIHYAPFPRELVERCLEVGCRRGGTVLDPFVGSGTTVMAALRRRLSAIGIDLKAKYCDFVIKQIQKELVLSRKR